jgi:AhpD family alkylhydroperoxidase
MAPRHRQLITDIYPDGFAAVKTLSEFSTNSGLDKTLQELIKMRASQLNGCIFCLDMHVTEARNLGFSDQRIFTLTAWHDSPFFTEKEKSVLALTDAMTLVAEEGVPDEIYEDALEQLGEEDLAKAMMAICVINTWNRLMIATDAPPLSAKKLGQGSRSKPDRGN